MYGLLVDASEEGELHLVMDANVSKPIQCLLPFSLIAFSFKRLVRPPFSWLCHQEPLPWRGDQLNGSVIPIHAHGPNRLARDET
jgi:hypothetical protein